MKIRKVFAITLFLVASSASSNQVDDVSHAEIRQVIENFRLSIIEKDEKKFNSLFYDKSIPWLGVRGDSRSGSLPSQSGVKPGSYVQFISWIVSSKQTMEEKFWDIEIISDDEIASVHFKYSFHLDDYKSNWGDEAWHLIKTGNGWKISSVVYSVTANPEPNPKKS